MGVGGVVAVEASPSEHHVSLSGSTVHTRVAGSWPAAEAVTTQVPTGTSRAQAASAPEAVVLADDEPGPAAATLAPGRRTDMSPEPSAATS